MRGGGRGRKRGRGKASGGRGGGNAAASTVDMEAGLEKQQPTGESRISGIAHREQETEENQCMIQKEGMKSSGVNKATIKGLAAGRSMAGVATNKILKVPTGSRHVNKRKKVTGGGIHRPPENKAGFSVKEVVTQADEEELPSPPATAKAHVVGIAKSVSKKKETGQIISEENVEKKFEHENVRPAIEIKQMKPAATADPVVVEVSASEEEKVTPDDVIANEQEGGEGREKANANAPLLGTGVGQQQVNTAGGQKTSESLNETSLTNNEKVTFGLVSSTVHTKSSKPANSSTCTTTGTTLGSIDVLNPWFLSGGTPNFRPKGSSQAGNNDDETWMGLQSCTAGLGEIHNANATDSDCTTYSTVQSAIKSEKDASRHFDSKLLQALLHDS